MSDHAHAADATGHGEQADHHVLPVALYIKVYGALLVLTYLTVQVSYWALGALSLPVAMAVAVVKAGFVIGFFMHLRYDTRFHSLIFFGTILFLTIFASFTLFDLTARGAMVQEIDTFVYDQEEQARKEAVRAEEIAAMPPEERPVAEPEEEAPAPAPGHKPMSDKAWDAQVRGSTGPQVRGSITPEAPSW